MDDFLLVSNLAGSFSILGATWSKTSFAITVLRLSEGWTRRFVWFVIVSLNVFLGLSVAFTWAQCTPIEKTWKPSLEGSCWPKYAVIGYNIFTAGEFPKSKYHRLWIHKSNPLISLLWSHGYHPRLHPLGYYLDVDAQQEGESRCTSCDEHGNLVS